MMSRGVAFALSSRGARTPFSRQRPRRAVTTRRAA